MEMVAVPIWHFAPYLAAQIDYVALWTGVHV